MALETLKGINKIGEFKVASATETYDLAETFIFVDHDRNSIHFVIQNGPVKENGVNGCQVDTIIAAAKIMIEGLNKNFPCRENPLAITKLDEALLWLGKRKADREARGVEGFNKE